MSASEVFYLKPDDPESASLGHRQTGGFALHPGRSGALSTRSIAAVEFQGKIVSAGFLVNELQCHRVPA